MLAMANKNGFVFGSEPGLANRARVPLDAAIKALNKFMAPDEYSRSKEHGGRRIEKVDGGWHLLNYTKHRAIRDEEERREYLKNYMRVYRKQPVNNVNPSKPQLSQAEAEAEAEAENTKNKVKYCVRPALEEVKSFCSEKNLVDPQEFLDYYNANGWKVGRNSMKDWKSAVRTWERKRGGTQTQTGNKAHVTQAAISRIYEELHPEDDGNSGGELFKLPTK